ncbi:hypothetical protein HA46_12665 [Pantoea septica]|uniref:Secreted protein n=1 Tax=Pantoea septica TaxID=472695 RepID=A0ABX3UQQ5_9GAMM|nr:hypothetical protein HA46_12665 [Pantoea septica]
MCDKLFFITILIVIKITFRHILQNCTTKIKLYKKTENIVLHELFILKEKESPVISVAANRLRHCIFFWLNFLRIKTIFHSS